MSAMSGELTKAERTREELLQLITVLVVGNLYLAVLLWLALQR